MHTKCVYKAETAKHFDTYAFFSVGVVKFMLFLVSKNQDQNLQYESKL